MNVTYKDGSVDRVHDVPVETAEEMLRRFFGDDGERGGIDRPEFFRDDRLPPTGERMSNGKPYDPARVPLTDQFRDRR